LSMGDGVTDDFGNNEHLRLLNSSKRNCSVKEEGKENKETHICSLVETSPR
jgi:hypothetical protein